MNKILDNNQNKAVQQGKCCNYCGKNYLKKTNLDKHIIICELLNTSKTKTIVDEEDEIPSQRKIYQILLELGSKYNKLEEKVDELNKWVVKKKKKINVVEWLNNHMTPEIKFETLIEKIIVEKEDVQYLFQNTFADTLNQIFSRNIYNISENEFPIFAFVQKTNVFYIYESEEAGWMELNREKLVKFLNRVHTKLYRLYLEWKKENKQQIEEDEKLSLLCDKTTCKMMDVDFRQESVLGKIRSNMYGRMKTDMKALVEYDFEF
jgi:hypothetical protein